MTVWPLQDARNRFSAVVDAAIAGDPQRVTRRGRPAAVVVLAVEEYERQRHAERAMVADYHIQGLPGKRQRPCLPPFR